MKTSLPLSSNMRVMLLAVVVACPVSLAAQTRQWSAQTGTGNADMATGVALDSDYLYLAGGTAGSIARTNLGQRDAYVIQYDRNSGQQIWAEQIGSSGDDIATGVAIDNSRNVYLVGTTTDVMPTGRHHGGTDVWLAKYNNGTQVWLVQLGTASDDFATAIVVDRAGRILVTGYTAGSLGGANQGEDDIWVASFDGAGSQLWLRQLGTAAQDRPFGVTTDIQRDVYITGLTKGAMSGSNLGGADAFMVRFDTAGNQIWIRQFGTPDADIARSAAIDSAGNILIAGHTRGALSGSNAGGDDAFVAQFDGSGTQRWLRQFGTPGDELANGVAVDSLDQVYVAGETTGSLGDVNQGMADAWAARYDAQGTQVWLHQTGTPAQDTVNAIAVDAACQLDFVGTTSGSLGGSNSGGDDAYVMQYSQSPTIPSFIPNSGATATAVVIRGSNFYGVTSVTFNNAPANFTVNSATQLTATLPAAASTGRIRVTTACQTATSATDFIVTTPPAVILTATPTSRTINAGQTTTYDINISRTNYPGSISLSVSGQPTGSSVSFSTNRTTGTFSRMSVTPPLNTPGGTYTLTIRATAAGIGIPTLSVTLRVNPVSVSLSATPASRSVYVGQSATYTININRTNFTGTVDLSGSFLWPPGVGVSFNPSRTTGNSSTLTLTTHALTQTGTLTLSVRGTSPGLTIAPINVSLTVNPVPVTLVAGNSTNTITACEPASYDILINRTNYPGAVDLSVSGLPVDATASFSSDPTTGSRSTLTVSTKCSTPAGTSTLTIGATIPAFTALPISVTLTVNPNPAYWQLGSSSSDRSKGIAVDSGGNVYVAGTTCGDFDGSGPGTFAGLCDGWVGKYTSTGTLRWVRQLGSPAFDNANAVAVDAVGNVYVTGDTRGDIDGPGPYISSGDRDLWVAKFNSSGALQWLTQEGQLDTRYEPTKIAVDGGGNVYVAGRMTEGFISGDGDFVSRFTSTGAFSWRRPHHPREDANIFITGLASDAAGNVYVTGGAYSFSTTQPFPAYSWLDKFDSNGNNLLNDYNESTFYWDVAVDSAGDIYLAGDTSIDFDGNGPGTHSGDEDVWLAKYDSNFNLIWSKQYGTPAEDKAYAMKLDSSNNVYLFGSTTGDLDGPGPGIASNNLGGTRWLARLNSSGEMLWLKQGGILPAQEFALDNSGSIYFADLSTNYQNAQIAKFSDSVLPYFFTNSFTPTAGPPGTTVTISGNHFTGATSVTFNGVPATFDVNFPTQITATVPNGATTGKIMVATSCGVAFTTTDFIP